jgi:aryl-alcohol dehydrogenase-like predicted oxidoreductase
MTHTDITDYAVTNKLTPFISMQNHHNLLYREEEREMFPTLKVRKIMRCLADFITSSSAFRCRGNT